MRSSTAAPTQTERLWRAERIDRRLVWGGCTGVKLVVSLHLKASQGAVRYGPVGSQRLRRALCLVLCAVAEAAACGQHSAYLSGGLFHFWVVGCFPRRWSRAFRWVRRIAILAGLVPHLLVLAQAPRVGAPTCPSACLGRGGATVQSVRGGGHPHLRLGPPTPRQPSAPPGSRRSGRLVHPLARRRGEAHRRRVASFRACLTSRLNYLADRFRIDFDSASG